MSEDWQRLEAIFHEALTVDAAERPAFLLRACDGDSALLKELQELLQAPEETIGFLAKPIWSVAGQIFAGAELAGTTIGQYRIIRLLGEGGMGRVYLADRADDQYRSLAAIKVVSTFGPNREAMILRFRAERQILANLQHAHIARLLDGGVTPNGEPYLVLEYVQGMPIDAYCRSKNLSIDERLRLFHKVVTAVEYAHRHLVVHRDIKPNNILVNLEGEPKLLDFGIAKLLDETRGPDSPLLTRNTERLMTPEYASPEQVRGEVASTSTDVYGLGALLYELLCGQRPFQFESRSPLEIARIICEKTPPPPSTLARVSSAPTFGDLRRLGRDLDNIVLKAMRKEPANRYASAGMLSADIQAFLNGYPVSAREDGWIYRSNKFVRRHLAGVAIAVAAVIGLIAFSIGMGVLAQRASLAQRRAEKETEFLTSMFRAASPDEARGHEITARDLLDRGARRIDRELAADPGVRIPLLITIARAYRDLGAYDTGLSLLERAFGKPGSNSHTGLLDRADAFEREGTLHRLKSEYATAEPLFREAFSIRQRILGDSDSRVALSLANLGECLYLERKDTEAESLLRKGLAMDRAQTVDEGDDVRNYLALLLERKGEFKEAARLLGEAVQITRRLEGVDSPNYGNSLHNWASALIDVGDLQGAETQLKDLLVTRRRILGSGHPDLTYTLNNIGYVLLEQGHWRDAGPYLKESLGIRLKALGADNPMVAPSWNNWARYLQAKGDYAEAGNWYHRALALATKESSTNWVAAQITSNLGVLEFDQGNYSAAAHFASSALEMRQQLGAKDNPVIASSLLELGIDRLYEGDAVDAESLFSKSLSIRQNKLSPENPAVMTAETRLSEALMAEGKFSEAESYLKLAVDFVHAPPFALSPWQVAEVDGDYAFCENAGTGDASQRLVAEATADLRGDPRPAFRKSAFTRLTELTQLWHRRASAH